MNHFCIIGIHPLLPSLGDGDSNYADKAEAIQKALWGKNEWLYFYKGYSIADDGSYIEVSSEALRDFSFYDIDKMKVSVCAIVGKNGSGKSRTVDLMIRIRNNLSAVLLGEKVNFAAAEHLHFIDHVYAELAFRIGNAIYVLEERGRRIVLHKYMRNRTSGNRFMKISGEELLSEPTTTETTTRLLKKHKKGRVILKSLFYTLVCNYSLYGFNYRDYFMEATPIERLLKLYRKKGELKIGELVEDHLWLKGIFHKNDGYQTPIVLHPMRQDGRLNISKENFLAKERMCNLLFYKDATGNYPQRVINGNLHIIALHISPTINKKFARDKMLQNIGIGKQQNIYQHFEDIYQWILDFWNSKYDFKACLTGQKLDQDACDYIVYKTLKIISNYRKYRPVYNYLSKTASTYDEFCNRLQSLAEDYTHITKKLLRTIMYVKKDIYKDAQNNYILEDLDAAIGRYIGEELHPKYRLQEIDLLPPPIFDVTLFLRKEGQDGVIDFRNLSSGERQIAYTISNFMYHLVNVDSEWNDYYRDFAHWEVIKYKYVNVIFDEVELYFHPEMQRSFMGLLHQALQNAKFRNLCGINIILATHSPFILSDIPHSNVLCLGENAHEVEGTLGANIIELLGNSFFLSSVIGKVATRELIKLVSLYQRAKDGEDVRTDFGKHKVEFQYLLKYLADPYLKSLAHRRYEELKKICK